MSARPTTCQGGPGDIRGEGKQHVGVGRAILGERENSRVILGERENNCSDKGDTTRVAMKTRVLWGFFFSLHNFRHVEHNCIICFLFLVSKRLSSQEW